MRNIQLTKQEGKFLAEHYGIKNIDVNKTIWLTEDGYLVSLNKDNDTDYFYDENLIYDFNYYVLQNYIATYGYQHTNDELNYLKSLDATEVEIRNNDIYIYDPQGILNITLGNTSDGWTCLYENWF